MDIQKANEICEFDTGYVVGDLSQSKIKETIYREIDRWKDRGNDKVDIVLATPPCQGISVINHKKNDDDRKRNSLVVESVEVVKQIRPRIFIFENVMAFQKTACTSPDGKVLPIGEYINESLGSDYIISGRVLNLMNYGSNSSRTRTIMIGVSKKYKDSFTPLDLYPKYRKEKTLHEVIHNFTPLEWGEIDKSDFYHAFRIYDSRMRSWIAGLKEGESAFDNSEPTNRPHRIIDGKIVQNIRKNRDKYTRQPWHRFIQCIHTRNDQLAAQNTIHPEQDRVYSIRELMEMMTIPKDFKWTNSDLKELNNLSTTEKKSFYKANELTIRACIGEAVPTQCLTEIGHNIYQKLFSKRFTPTETNKLITKFDLTDRCKLKNFIEKNPLDIEVTTLMRIAELCNAKREDTAAFYTNKFLVNEIMGRLPNIGKDEIRIIEPSVGAGNFLPFLFKRYENVERVLLDIVEIDEDSVETLGKILEKIETPRNFTINLICEDFLTMKISHRYDLAVGNPPFSKLKGNSKKKTEYLAQNINKDTSNLSEMFLEKCMRISDCVALVLNKTILSTQEFDATRDMLRKLRIESIIDFGRYGFTGVSIETICLIVYPKKKPKTTYVSNLKFNRSFYQNQSYITDTAFPYFIIYRDSEFDSVANKLQLNVFDVFRDRQITKTITSTESTCNTLWVVKARNINDDGTGITQIQEYDQFLPEHKAKTLSAYKYVNNTNVYLTPNMTYNPRVIENIPNSIPDGSTAVLIPKTTINLTTKQRAYFSSEEYRRFYKIARNLSTQSINVDKKSVFFYGILKSTG